MEKPTLKALDNMQASTQQEKFHGYNIGMWCVNSGLRAGFLKAIENEKALNQVDKSKKSLRYMAEHYGIPSVTEKLKELDGRKFTDSEVESEM